MRVAGLRLGRQLSALAEIRHTEHVKIVITLRMILIPKDVVRLKITDQHALFGRVEALYRRSGAEQKAAQKFHTFLREIEVSESEQVRNIDRGAGKEKQK